MGVYVQDLSKWPVTNYAGLSKKIEEGNRNRTIASTAMNTHSSRAHTLISIGKSGLVLLTIRAEADKHRRV